LKFAILYVKRRTLGRIGRSTGIYSTIKHHTTEVFPAGQKL
jgi:hypothetical protein